MWTSKLDIERRKHMDAITKDLHQKSSRENPNGKWRRLSTPNSTDDARSFSSSFDGKDSHHQKILGFQSRTFPLRI